MFHIANRICVLDQGLGRQENNPDRHYETHEKSRRDKRFPSGSPASYVQTHRPPTQLSMIPGSAGFQVLILDAGEPGQSHRTLRDFDWDSPIDRRITPISTWERCSSSRHKSLYLLIHLQFAAIGCISQPAHCDSMTLF